MAMEQHDFLFTSPSVTHDTDPDSGCMSTNLSNTSIRSSAIEREIRDRLIKLETKFELFVPEDKEFKVKLSNFMLSYVPSQPGE